MRSVRSPKVGAVSALALVAFVLLPVRFGRADDVVLKSGLMFRGSVDKDNTLRMVSDHLRRVFLRDSKIESIKPGDPYRNLEHFQLVQPLDVHGGSMPVYAIDVRSTAWNEKGRRDFRYVGPKSTKPVIMTQAINDLGPRVVRYRGIDGFWVSQIGTERVPKEVVLGLLARVDRKSLTERQRVARFIWQAEWLAEAKVEIESLAKDFPDQKEKSKENLALIRELELRLKRTDLTTRLKSRQPKGAREVLKSLPAEGLPSDVEAEVVDIRKKLDLQDGSDRALAQALRDGWKGLTPENEKAWKDAEAEILKNLGEAPDAVRDRLVPFSQADPNATPENRLALAVSGWVGGDELASPDLAVASSLWKARAEIRNYLIAKDENGRQVALDALNLIERPKDAKKAWRLD